MQVNSLGYRTDLIFHRFDGQVLDRGDYLVIKTPTNPTFYWGNFLLFAEPPGDGDDVRWTMLASAASFDLLLGNGRNQEWPQSMSCASREIGHNLCR